MIHSTAIIDPSASIGADCHIGPYCVIGPDVTIGDGCNLHSHVVIDGYTTLGKENDIFPFASIGLKTQDLKWSGGKTYTRIGDRNTIRESVTVHSATSDGESTVIGSDNNILAYCHVAHNCQLGDHIIMSNSTGLAGHVTIEDFVVFGGMTGVHQFCRIGTMAMVGGCSRISQDVCPFTLVNGNPPVTAGLNKVGLERRQLSSETQGALKEANKLIFRSNLSLDGAIEAMEAQLAQSPEIDHLLAFLKSSDRGITR